MTRTGIEMRQPPKLPASHYVDNRIYSDPGIFEEERTRIFGKIWKFICHESEVAARFDFRTLDFAATPLIVARGADGRIRSFLNSCSHRGARIVRELSGNAESFTCPFHLWSYDTAGACTAITRDDAYRAAGCDKATLGLREFRTEVRCGLVFVTLDDDAEDIDTFLGEALENLEAILSTEPIEVYHYNEVVMQTNWKNWQELDSELYHEYLHIINRRTGLTMPTYFTRTWKFYPNGHATLVGPPLTADYGKQPGWKSQREGRVLPGLQANEYRVVDLWPDTAFVVRDSGIRIDTQVPLAPDRTLVQFRALAPVSDTTAEREARYRDHNQFWGPFGRNVQEDTIAAELQVEGMSGGHARYSLIAREESGLTQDEVTLRRYYAEWSRRMGRPFHNAVNAPAA